MVPVTHTAHRISHWSFLSSNRTCSVKGCFSTLCTTRSVVVKKQNAKSRTPTAAISAIAAW